jgi:hypothetical protein
MLGLTHAPGYDEQRKAFLRTPHAVIERDTSWKGRVTDFF